MRPTNISLSNILKAFADADADALPMLESCVAIESLDSYTRQEAIEDGVLIDVTKSAKVCGIPYHAAFTAGLWAEAIAYYEGPFRQESMSEETMIECMLESAVTELQRLNSPPLEMPQSVLAAFNEVYLIFRAMLCLGDDGLPVLTLMQQYED